MSSRKPGLVPGGKRSLEIRGSFRTFMSDVLNFSSHCKNKITVSKNPLKPNSSFPCSSDHPFLYSLKQTPQKNLSCDVQFPVSLPSRLLSTGCSTDVSLSPVTSSGHFSVIFLDLPAACKSWSHPLLWNVFFFFLNFVPGNHTCGFPLPYWLLYLWFFFFKFIWWITFLKGCGKNTHEICHCNHI